MNPSVTAVTLVRISSHIFLGKCHTGNFFVHFRDFFKVLYSFIAFHNNYRLPFSFTKTFAVFVQVLLIFFAFLAACTSQLFF